MARGGRFYKATMFLSGQMFTAALIMIVMFSSVYPASSPYWLVWLTLFVALGIGAGIGYATMTWARMGVLCMGAWIGGLIGGLLYTMVFYLFATDNPLLVLWLTIAFCGVIVSVLSMIFFDHAIIIGSAIGGSYMALRVSYLHSFN